MVSGFLTLESLTPAEQNAVTQLKQKMVDCMDPEMYSDLSVFVRFLRARNLDVNAAELMLRNHLQWRKVNRVDKILTDYTPKEVLKKYMTGNIMGIDKEGSPIIYVNGGSLDCKGILKSCRKIDIVMFFVQLLEESVAMLKQQSIKRNKTIDKWTMILNFQHFPLSLATHKETLEMIGQLCSMYDANYPERMKVVYIINGSFYFSLGFAVVKQFIAEQTRKKIKIYGNDGWLEDVLSLVPVDVLPAFLGGKKTDPDGNPLCKSFITQPDIVDESYYVRKKQNSIVNLPDVKTLMVTRMSKTRVPFYVFDIDYYLEWEFETKNRDIAFCILYKKHENDELLQELIPKQRVDTYLCSETGTMKCENPGIYIVEFDNSFSWIFRKEVYYRVTVKKY